MAPAQAGEVVPQRLGQVAHLPVGLDAQRAVALGQLGPVRSVDQRDVAHLRHEPAHGVIDDDLAGSVGQVVIAADDVGDTHVVVIDDHGEHVGRRAIGAEDDEVIQVFGLEHDFALHLVVHPDFA